MTSTHRLSGSGPEPFEACPDGGRCWHGCPLIDGGPEGKGLPCWRVLHANPLTAHGEDWTAEEQAEHEVARVLHEHPGRVIARDRLPEVAALVRRALNDPGAWVPRGPDYDGNAYGERLDRWQDRAIEAALGSLS